MVSALEQSLSHQDTRLRHALDEARTLTHHGTAGAEYEAAVLRVLDQILPGSFTSRGTLLANATVEKQLDVVAHARDLPAIFLRAMPINAMALVGEVKTTLSDKQEIGKTALKLSKAAAEADRLDPVPFFVLSGTVKAKEKVRWLCELLGQAIQQPQVDRRIWPAAFNFETNASMSALRVGANSPVRLARPDGSLLDGVATIDESELSPSAALYVWVWACLFANRAFQGMDFRFLREAVGALCQREGGLEVHFLPATDFGRDGVGEIERIAGALLYLPEDLTGRAPPVADLPIARMTGNAAAAAGTPAEQSMPLPEAEAEADSRSKYTLIRLGPWQDEFDTWDESPWGGRPTASRAGYGYRPGMAQQALLDSARVFWRINPHSRTWQGITHAVVAHEQRVVAVIQIEKYIGPVWGRYGFQGRIDNSRQHLIGRTVPRGYGSPVGTVTL